jgi:hypothetical protein
MQQWQPGHWFGPVTQPFFYHATQIKNKKTKKNKKSRKNKKNKRCVCMNKNNINLLVYSLTPESGIKIPI